MHTSRSQSRCNNVGIGNVRKKFLLQTEIENYFFPIIFVLGSLNHRKDFTMTHSGRVTCLECQHFRITKCPHGISKMS